MSPSHRYSAIRTGLALLRSNAFVDQQLIGGAAGAKLIDNGYDLPTSRRRTGAGADIASSTKAVRLQINQRLTWLQRRSGNCFACVCKGAAYGGSSNANRTSVGCKSPLTGGIAGHN